jgi:hypothetical protein
MKPVLSLPLFLLYFFLCLGVLSYIPIAWIDEAMFADAARNLAQTGQYASRLWEQPQTEKFLLGHLPLWQLLLALWYKVFPTTIFWTRLPGLLLYAGFAVMAWFYFSKLLNINTALVITLLCVGDKAIFEAARSVRMDILGAFLLMFLATGLLRKWNALVLSLACGLLTLVHPNFWLATLILGIPIFLQSKSKWQTGIIGLLPIILYLIWIFPWRHLITVQLLANGGDHIRSDGNIIEILQDYFFIRYFKWYEIQQILPILYIVTLFSAPFLFFREEKFRPVILLLWAQTLFLIIMTGNYPRYNLPVVISVWLLFPLILKRLPESFNLEKFKNSFIIISLSLALYPLISRTALAWYQKTERDPDRLLAWLNTSLPDNPQTLLIDEAIGYYLQRPGTDFGFLHSIDKFDLCQYKGGIYRLTYQTLPSNQWKLMSSYSVEEAILPAWIPMRQTYRGLLLYQYIGLVDDSSLVTKPYKGIGS